MHRTGSVRARNKFRFTLIWLLAFWLTPITPAFCQKTSDPSFAAISGIVHDASGQPVSEALVELRRPAGTVALSTRTDASGRFQFTGLQAGTYVVHAQASTGEKTKTAPLTIRTGEARLLDLTLESAKPDTPASQQPEFFDKPQFTVAGVTDTSNLGGHGSNATSRAKTELTRDVVSLSNDSASPSSASVEQNRIREKSLRDALTRDPHNPEANRDLGTLLASLGKNQEAIPYLQRATQLAPGDFHTAYTLAQAYAANHQYQDARNVARPLLNVKEPSASELAGLHHLMGTVEEKSGNPLEAVRQYQRAAELDPTEPHLFDWGADLLLHNAPEPAAEVFTKGNRLFPKSSRMLMGLGVAWYARGVYDKAAQYLAAASDLDPLAPVPYLFLGRLQVVDTASQSIYSEKLERFVQRHPESPQANYYYALTLWKQRKSPADATTTTRVDSLLNKSISLDPTFALPYVLQGTLYSERGDSARSISAFEKAVEVDPKLTEAHYRLAQAYKRAGQPQKAEAQLSIYNRLSNAAAEKEDRERREIRQFVYTLQNQTAPPR